MDIKLKHLVADKDRHGNVRFYVRVKGAKKQRIKAEPGSREFLDAYQAATLGVSKASPAKVGTNLVTVGTLRWLGHEYFASSKFKTLDPTSQRNWRRILEKVFDEPRKPGAAECFGECPLSRFSADHVAVLRDRKAETPAAANNMLKRLSAMFTWGIKNRRQHVTHHPVRGAEKVRYRVVGHHAWTVAEVEQYLQRHPPGTMACLALCLMLFTGARTVDAYKLGRQHIRNGWLRFQPRKTRNSTGLVLDLPVVPVLQQIIDLSPCGDMTFLQSGWKRAFASEKAFGNWFADRCDEAGLPHCRAHGLRGAGASILAELGRSEHELMAIFGWSSIEEALKYTRAARRKRMAGRALPLLAQEWTENVECPTFVKLVSHQPATS